MADKQLARIAELMAEIELYGNSRSNVTVWYLSNDPNAREQIWKHRRAAREKLELIERLLKECVSKT